MPHKTFEDEEFVIKNLKLDVNSLTVSDPYVDHVKIIPESGNVDVIKYSANKKVSKSGEITDPVSGIKFDSEEEVKEDQRVSDLPEVLKKIRAKLQTGHEVKVKTNIGRYTNENGENASFYITDDHLEGLELVVDDGEESEKNSENEEKDGVIV
jgi:DUF4097 and DUF4098 domain-containing protein YvlB